MPPTRGFGGPEEPEEAGGESTTVGEDISKVKGD